MENKKIYNRARTVKLDKDEDSFLQLHCKKLDIDVSTFIRQAINEKLDSGHVSNVAGTNNIEYDRQNDSFIWKVKTDDGVEKKILEDISIGFVEDLGNRLKRCLEDRNKLIGKNGKKSVSVPRRLMK